MRKNNMLWSFPEYELFIIICLKFKFGGGYIIYNLYTDGF